jgi:peroxiredoxin
MLETVTSRALRTVHDEPVTVPDATRLVHLQFRRFAGCPVCNLHLRSFERRHDELIAAGIEEVVVFHAPDDELRPRAGDLPFAVVGDPDKRLYGEFGIESSPRALLDPRAWPGIVHAVAVGVVALVLRRKKLPRIKPTGGRLGLPGDFLIAPDGRIVASKHGVHADDQWSVDEVLRLAAEASSPGPQPAPPATSRTQEVTAVATRSAAPARK